VPQLDISLGQIRYVFLSRTVNFPISIGFMQTLSSVQAFFMLIANNQDVQKEAHKELDALLGDTPNRLPTYADKDQLPFTTAITKELLRWHVSFCFCFSPLALSC
jgi:hypothetical protein